jgi:uncharacterized protein YjbJ (UPF0337 family)
LTSTIERGVSVEWRSKNKYVLMGVGDKAEGLTRKVEEGLGDATDNRAPEAEGQAEQAAVDAEWADDDVADAQLGS